MPGLLKRKRIRMEEDKENLSSASDSSPQKKFNKGNDLVSPMRRSLRKTGKPDFYSSPALSMTKSPSTVVQRTSLTPSSTTSSTVESSQESSEPAAEQSNSAEEFSDEEVTFKKPITSKGPKKKATEQKKAPVKNNATPAKSTLKGKQQASKEDEEKESLFEIVKGSKGALRAVIDDWIEAYSEEREAALVDLIQFFVQCCGCKGKVSREMIEGDDSVTSVRELTKTFDEEGSEYPLVMTGPAYKKFKANFCHFIELLINQCQFNIIYDEMMMDVLLSWLIGLSDSQVRAFRHTSTLAGMKIVSALVDVALKVGVESDNTQRQLDNENQKPPSKRSREKLEMLQKKREELRQQVADVHEMMNRIFTGIFVHRYRDVRPEVRAVCITEIGHWMKTYSTHFLTQNYLKYSGWTLHDKVGEVRLKALESLEGLYENEDFKSHLELFTERFKDRIVSMTLDKEPDVAVGAIKVVCLLHRYNVLDDDDCHQVEQLVFCNQRQVAHAAGKFLALRLFSDKMKESPRKGKKGSESYIRQQNIKSLVDFLLDTEIHYHSAYILDSLWEHTALVKDWGTMTDMLLDSNCHVDLNDKQEGALIEIMAVSCGQAATGKEPIGRQGKKVVSNKEKRNMYEDRHNLSIHFMENLPDLLAKFGTDVDKALELVTIPQQFELEVYAEKRLTKRLDDLLSHIEDIVLKHADSKLLYCCAKTMGILAGNDLIIRQSVEVARDKLIDKVVDRFRESLAVEIPTDDEDKDESSYYTLVTNLKRIAAFYRAHDLGSWELEKDFFAIIEQGAKGSVDREVLLFTLQSMHSFLIWKFEKENKSDPDKAALKSLKRQIATFVSQLDELVQYSNEAVQKEALHILSDVLVYFSKQLRNTAPLMAPIAYEADKSMQVRIRDCVMSRVFGSLDEDEDEDGDDEDEDDSKAQELHNKRLMLASFCKLVTFDLVEMKLVAPVFSFFMKAYASYADIIKHTMSKTRENNPIAFTRTLLLSLEQSFEMLRDEQGGQIDKTSEDFNALKNLAHRFALILGVNTVSNQSRKCSLTIHREGIQYALSQVPASSCNDSAEDDDVPPNLLFLEILNEFTYRLIYQDRKGKNGILPYLEEKSKDYLSKKGNSWSPLITYRNYLKGDGKTAENLPQAGADVAENDAGNGILRLEDKESANGSSKSTGDTKVSQSKQKASENNEAVHGGTSARKKRVHYENVLEEEEEEQIEDDEEEEEGHEEDSEQSVEDGEDKEPNILESPRKSLGKKLASKRQRVDESPMQGAKTKSKPPVTKGSRTTPARKTADLSTRKGSRASPSKGRKNTAGKSNPKSATKQLKSPRKSPQKKTTRTTPSPKGNYGRGKASIAQSPKKRGRNTASAPQISPAKKRQRTPLSANSSQSSTPSSSEDFISPQLLTSQQSWLNSQRKRGAKGGRGSYSTSTVTPMKRRRSSDLESSQDSLDQFSSPERKKRGRKT